MNLASSADVLSNALAPVGLDHVQVAAPPGCEPQGREFYGGLLGLREVSKPVALRAGSGVWFALGPGQLHIGAEDPFTPARKAHPALRMADEPALEALAERLQAAGADVIWDADIPGTRRFFTYDPWGNRVELLASSASNPA